MSARELARELALWLEALTQTIADAAKDEIVLQDWLGRLGFTLPRTDQVQQLRISAELVATAVKVAVGVADAPVASIENISTVLNALKVAIESVVGFAAKMAELSPGINGSLAARRAIDALVLDAFARSHPALAPTLIALGLVDAFPGIDLFTEAIQSAPPTTRIFHRLALERLPGLLTDPVSTLRGLYAPTGLSTNADSLVASDRLMPMLANIALGLELEAIYGSRRITFTTSGAQSARGVLLVRRPARNGDPGEAGVTVALASAEDGGPAVALAPFGAIESSFDIGPWNVALTASAASGAILIGPGKFAVAELAETSFQASLAFTPRPSTSKWLIGVPGGTRIDLDPIGGSVQLAANQAKQDLQVDVLLQGEVVIAPGEGDGFLREILGTTQLASKFRINVGWSRIRGPYFGGTAGLSAQLPLDIAIGDVIRLQGLRISLEPATRSEEAPARVTISVGTAIAAKLGPFAASVDQFGLRLDALFTDEPGNLGPVNFAFAPLMPTGIGLSLDAGPVQGAGFLSIQDGRYTGIVQLSVLGFGLTAIGVVDTKPPWGEGYALFLLIAAQIPNIQLGFGFTLNGIGGLAGINRRVDTDALAAACLDGHLDHVLFPTDPARDAATIIASIDRIFPLQKDSYVFAFLIKIGWATFIEAKLGLLIGIGAEPGRDVTLTIAVLGRVDCYIPLKQTPLIELHLDIVGYIDTGKKAFGFVASLHDSRICLLSVSGQMAMRVTWGERPSFALSLGGFHPSFTPPPDFPPLARFSIVRDIIIGRISFTAYFAITSNTVQFGARIDLVAQVGPLSVEGYAAFDAIFYFNPFSFEVQLAAGVALKFAGVTVAGLSVALELKGPTPWHITGEISVSILFTTIKGTLDVKWGNELPVYIKKVSPWRDKLRPEIELAHNWGSTLPSVDVAVLVDGLGSGDDAFGGLVHPFGSLRFSQTAVPLNREIQKIGEALLEDVEELTFGSPKVTIGETVQKLSMVQNSFAPGHFTTLEAKDRFTTPSFESMDCGFEVRSDAIRVPLEDVRRSLESRVWVLNSGDAEPKVAPVGGVSSMLLEYALPVPTAASPAASVNEALFGSAPRGEAEQLRRAQRKLVPPRA